MISSRMIHLTHRTDSFPHPVEPIRVLTREFLCSDLTSPYQKS